MKASRGPARCVPECGLAAKVASRSAVRRAVLSSAALAWREVKVQAHSFGGSVMAGDLARRRSGFHFGAAGSEYRRYRETEKNR